MKVLSCIFCFCCVCAYTAFAWDLECYCLQNGAYSFTEWSKESPAGTYPPSMLFLQSKTKDPKLNDTMSAPWSFAYNISSKSRLVGQGVKGISFVNTSTAQADGGGFLGEVVLAINTIDRKNINVSWKCRTLSTWAREYAIAMRYAIGNGELINTEQTYFANPKKDDSAVFKFKLPESAENTALVYLSWKYYSTDDSSGNRPNLGIDDIIVEAESISGIDEDDNITLSMIDGALVFNDEINDLQLFDFTGKNVYISDNPQRVYVINHLPSGVYIVRYNSEGKTYTRKIIKTD